MWDRALGVLGLARATTPRVRGTYFGAQQNRLHGDWLMGSVSANAALEADVLTLRNRARKLVISNSTAARIPSLYAQKIVGKDGILFQARVRSTRDRSNDRVNQQLEDAWYRWCEPRHCTVDGRLSWPEVEALIASSEPVDGEVLIRLVRRFDNPFGFAIELLDPDQLDVRHNMPAAAGRNEIRMGVEVNSWQRPVAYWLWTNHPSDGRKGRDRIRVPASDILHVYDVARPGQTRGVTAFAPVIVDLKMLGGYREAELVAARTASAKMGFIQQRAGSAEAPMTPESDGDTTIRFDADPGVIEQLPPGYEFSGWDPAHPTSAFAEFDKAIVRSIAVRFGITYMSLSGDLSDTSYGSGRIGMLDERGMWEQRQQRHIARVSMPIKDVWLEQAMLSGALALPSFDVKAYRACAWHPPPFPWLDPSVDVETAEREFLLGSETMTAILAKKGKDYEEVLQERQRERELRARYGEPEPTVKGAAAPPAPADDDTEDEDTDAREEETAARMEALEARLVQAERDGVERAADLREDLHALAVQRATAPVVVNVPNPADTLKALPAPAPVSVSVSSRPAPKARAMKLTRNASNEWTAELVPEPAGDA